jgi:hypothetical protein
MLILIITFHWEKLFHQIWKGDPSISGGIATNNGVHFFELLSGVLLVTY